MASPGVVLEIFAVAGTAGMVGQVARALVGLKKRTYDSAPGKADEFDAARLIVSLIIGSVAGIVTALSLGLDAFTSIDVKLLLALAAAGYSGSDVVEGLLGKITSNTSGKPPASGEEISGLDERATVAPYSANLKEAGVEFVAKTKPASGSKVAKSIGKRSEDVQSCISQWLQTNKGASSADSRNLTKNVADFHILANNEMEQFIGGVAQCLAGKGYTYTPVPDPKSPGWNQHVSKLLGGTLSALVSDFVNDIS